MELKNISYSVVEDGKEKNILHDINIKFESGKTTIITGQNGTGKSTLIKILMGILAPTSGSVFLHGKDITLLPIDKRAALGMTLAFQQPIKFKGLTVRDIINLASQKNSNLHDACEVLSMVGLCARDYLDRPLDDTLSGGELKRIELAMAIAKGGDTFLFDEPEAGIDLWSFEELVKLFSSLKGKTIIIVSHQQKILELADNIIILNHSDRPLIGTRKQMLGKIGGSKACGKLGGGK